MYELGHPLDVAKGQLGAVLCQHLEQDEVTVYVAAVGLGQIVGQVGH